MLANEGWLRFNRAQDDPARAVPILRVVSRDEVRATGAGVRGHQRQRLSAKAHDEVTDAPPSEQGLRRAAVVCVREFPIGWSLRVVKPGLGRRSLDRIEGGGFRGREPWLAAERVL